MSFCGPPTRYRKIAVSGGYNQFCGAYVSSKKKGFIR